MSDAFDKIKAREILKDCQELRDGGSRKSYGTGAQKEDNDATQGKGAYHLLPQVPLRKVAEIYRKGAAKYAARNWEKGLPLSRLLDSAERHLAQFHEGMTDEDHLHQAIWNLLAISHTMEMIERKMLPPSLNDLPSYGHDGEETEVYPGFKCSKWRKPGPGLDLEDKDKGAWPAQLEKDE